MTSGRHLTTIGGMARKQSRLLLAAYLKKHDLSIAEFAAKVGADRQRIYRYLDGERLPSAQMLAEIERATRGFVPAAGWTERVVRAA